MESPIVDFNQELYIPAIQKLSFNLPHVSIIGKRHCVNTLQELFKRRSNFQYVLCHRDYAERVVVRFAHQIQFEYYGGNRSVYI